MDLAAHSSTCSKTLHILTNQAPIQTGGIPDQRYCRVYSSVGVLCSQFPPAGSRRIQPSALEDLYFKACDRKNFVA